MKKIEHLRKIDRRHVSAIVNFLQEFVLSQKMIAFKKSYDKQNCNFFYKKLNKILTFFVAKNNRFGIHQSGHGKNLTDLSNFSQI